MARWHGMHNLLFKVSVMEVISYGDQVRTTFMVHVLQAGTVRYASVLGQWGSRGEWLTCTGVKPSQVSM